jgi:hypothetical protein
VTEAPATPTTDGKAESGDSEDDEVVFGYSPEKIGEMMEKTREVKKALEERQRTQQELME